MNKQEIETAVEIIASDKKAFEAVNHGGFTNKIKAFKSAISALEQQLTNGWIPASERLPEAYRKVDGDDVYHVSNNVLCSAYNGDMCEHETWIDYTIDGEWQTHEYYEGEKLAWQNLPEPWKGDTQWTTTKTYIHSPKQSEL